MPFAGRRKGAMITEETSYIADILAQKVVEIRHICLLPKLDIVGQVLDDLGDDHQASADYKTIISRHLDIHKLGSNHCR